MPPGMVGNIAMPFFHMQGEGFWHLVPLPGKEAFVASGRRLITESQLINNVAGARLDDDLFTLLAVKQSRDVLRAALIDANFDEQTQPLLWQRFAINQEAYLYSSELLAQARRQLKELQVPYDEAGYSPEARDQGFRRAVVVAYNHRCASCGLRIVTPGGHTAVEAAHIVPWHKTHNDQPDQWAGALPSLPLVLRRGADERRNRLSRDPVAATGNPREYAWPVVHAGGPPIFLPQETALYPDPANLDLAQRPYLPQSLAT